MMKEGSKMALFDFDGLPNLKTKTMGGETFWNDLDYAGEYTLQQNMFTGHCRILDGNDYRVAWGSEGEMRVKLKKLTQTVESVHAKYGDIIGVHRIGGVYDHYGVYESDDCVYEYAAENGDFGDPKIHITTLKKFIADSGNYFVLEFPETHGKPEKVSMPIANINCVMPRIDSLNILEKIVKMASYHLYSPAETIERAKSRLGENKYSLITNNCEHFAIWCKTGISESHQVEEILKAVLQIQ